jgi:2-hydroxycyclohexanecarboxyl-CoA dehydrogenase
MQLELGKVALVVGGASGIGLATARQFAAEGCHVVIWDLSQLDGPHQAFDHTWFQVDVRDRQSVTDALEATVDQRGSIDHMVVSAAIGSGFFGMPFTRVSAKDWEPVLAVNVSGLVNVANAVASHMMQQRQGTIVSVASVAGQIGSSTDPPYTASKAAGISFAQCMARDLASYGIRVNTVCPGMVKTPLNRNVWKSWRDRDPQQNSLEYDEWADQKIKELIPLGEWQQPSDVADMILFLSSRRAAQVTGQTINVDGGYVMHW